MCIRDRLNVEEYGVAFRKGSDAAEAVDNAFDELKADGTMQAPVSYTHLPFMKTILRILQIA